MHTRRTRQWRWLGLLTIAAALVAVPAHAADWEAYKAMYVAGEFQQLADLCQASDAEIAADPAAHIVYKYCGLAKLELYDANGQGTDLTTAIDYLERSIAFSYSEEAAYHLGLARMKSLDRLTDEKDRAAREWEALNDMWESIRNLHAMENFARDTLSDNMLIWAQQYRDALIERIVKDEGNRPRLPLLAAQARMLADRFEAVDPQLGENEIRQGNLKIFKEWMDELLRMSYFDNDIVVGMYKYRADRAREKYDQTAATEEQFTKALHDYEEAIKRAHTNKARATLFADVAYLCSLYNSEDQDKLVAYYKTGFSHAREGLVIMARLNAKEADDVSEEFPFETDNGELTAKLQKAYGSNLTGSCYFHHLKKQYAETVALQAYVFDTSFDWEGKDTTFLLIADAADKLAAEKYRDRAAFQRYRRVCLAAANRAFKSALKRFDGRPPQGSEDFCRVFNNYVNYLRRFGETVEAQNLTLQFQASCAAAE